MSGLDRFSVYATIVLVILIALTYGLCTVFSESRSYPKLSAVGLALVTDTDTPPRESYERVQPGPTLRIDFRARPSLAVGEATPFFQLAFCEKEREWGVWGGPIYVGKAPVWGMSPHEKAALGDTVYSAYFPIVDTPPAVPPGFTLPLAEVRWDLTKDAKPICAWGDYGSNGLVARQTNVMRFSKDQVAAALRASH